MIDFRTGNCCFYTFFYSHCHLTFPYKEIQSFFANCHVPFPDIELLSIFGRFVQKIVLFSFADSFVQKTTQQPDGSCNVTSVSQLLFKVFKKQPFFCKDIRKLFCEQRILHCASWCRKVLFTQLQISQFLLGNVEKLLQKLDPFQHMDCLYTLFKYGFSGKIVVKSSQVFDNVQRAVWFDQSKIGVDRMPSIAKKTLLRKKTESISWARSKKNKVKANQGISFWRKNWKISEDENWFGIK